ncbi:MAG: helix-turn-helix domain-containing protein, partial [Bacillota bacterium]|nr:helix-turn-helix domain-containing protein [Bacillota bacterium]
MASSRSDKRERILKAALGLVLERGLDETRVIDIARAAGVGKGTVYEYFPSKEALYLELFQEHVSSR